MGCVLFLGFVASHRGGAQTPTGTNAPTVEAPAPNGSGAQRFPTARESLPVGPEPLRATTQNAVETLCSALFEAWQHFGEGPIESVAEWPHGQAPRGEALRAQLHACATGSAPTDQPAGGEPHVETTSNAETSSRNEAVSPAPPTQTQPPLQLQLRLVDAHTLEATLSRRLRRPWYWRFVRPHWSIARRQFRIALDAHLRTYVSPLPRLRRDAVHAEAVRLPGHGYTGLEDGGVLAAQSILLADENTLRLLRLERRQRGRWRARQVTHGNLPENRSPLRPLTHLRCEGGPGAGSPGDGCVVMVPRAPLQRVSLAANGLQLQPAQSPCPPDAFPQTRACARLARGRDYFDSHLSPRVGHPAPERAPSSFYTRRAMNVRRTDGSQGWVEVLVSPGGRLVARTGDRSVGVMGHGAALAAMDIDDDGHLEILTSSNAALGQGDQLLLLRVRPDGSLHRVWSSQRLAGSVLHAAQADLDGDGRREFVAIEERDGQAWLWRVW